ncbi:restriction endonuclease subunit S [Companilactobacillus sp. HBUAS59699]|uniref:restriction endonuclease subunit S n=1 Tax=Companilactobacillus sp. HBUAS59699 TaxID=3109358 RepID=UPI003FA5EAA6
MGDVANIVRGASPRPIKNPKWFDNESDIGWLRISDVTEQNGRIHYLDQHISKMGQAKTRIITKKHLLLSIAATVGKPVINYVKTGVHDGFLIFLNPLFDIEFMFQWLEMFRPNWDKYGQPGSQVNLNSDIVKKQEVFLPNKDEQKEIGKLLDQIDKLYDLQQRNYSLIKLQKEFLMQNMFPTKSNLEPKIRFNTFNESWSRKKLGDYLKIPDKIKVDVKNTREIMTLKLNLGGISTDSSRKTLSLGSTTYYKRRSGQFLYGKQNFFNGSMAIIPDKFDGKVTSGDVPALDIVDVDSLYLYQYVSRHDYWKKAEGMATGTGSKRIHESTLQKLPITVPNKKEQALIGIMLNKSNEFIKVQELELKNLEILKRYLLQKLFV